MPIHWTIDSSERLLTVVAEGDVTRSDADAFLEVLEGGFVAYRKLFDGTNGETSMTGEDFMAIGARIRAGHLKGPVGALAVVLSQDKAKLVSRVLGIMATARRPMRLFDDVEEARRWIVAQPHE
ncbi:MAG: STAS/SEC14 domain-containing protein [Reyranella sp.]|jgi:hypothetical protein|nr:MAG: STAS/SEC14 domain-containing protein [Reyranella sp.]